MKDLFNKYKIPIIIVAVLIVAFIAYSYLKGGSSDNSNAVLTNNSATPSGTAGAGDEFVNQLLTLQNVQLNVDVFSDPRFQSLQDFSQPIPEQPQGRPNPFAPIGIDQVNSPTLNPTAGGAPVTFNSATSTSASSTKK